MTNTQCSIKDLKISVCPWHVFIQKWKLIILLLLGDSPNFTVNETQISMQAKTWILQRSKGKSKLLCQWVSNPRMRCAALSQDKDLNTEVTPRSMGSVQGNTDPRMHSVQQGSPVFWSESFYLFFSNVKLVLEIWKDLMPSGERTFMSPQ